MHSTENLEVHFTSKPLSKIPSRIIIPDEVLNVSFRIVFSDTNTKNSSELGDVFAVFAK